MFAIPSVEKPFAKATNYRHIDKTNIPINLTNCLYFIRSTYQPSNDKLPSILFRFPTNTIYNTNSERLEWAFVTEEERESNYKYLVDNFGVKNNAT